MGKISNMKETIGIIGIGRLGICFALNLEKKYRVIGADINKGYVDSINNKTFVSSEPQVNDMLCKSKDFLATTSLSNVVDNCDVIFVLVATPSLVNGKYDHSSVDSVIDQIIAHIKIPLGRPKHLIIGCTVMPEYCKSVHDKLSYYNISLAYNPEFIAQGDIINGQTMPDMVLIGESDKEIGDIVEEIHKSIICNHAKICRMGLTEAEITKIALNCFCTIKISYANMIGDLALKTGVNPDIILNAIGQDSRVGNKYLKYGDGFGGPCFPRDNRALNIFANDKGVTLKLSEVVDDSNKIHLDNQINADLNSGHDSITIEGIAYKNGSDIIEESQRLKRAVALATKGIKVTVIDSQIIIEKVKAIYGDLLNYNIRY